MKCKMRYVLLSLVFAFIGCATAPVEIKSAVDLGEGLIFTLPAPAEILKPVRARQLLTFSYQDKVKAVEALLELQNSKMTVTVFMPFFATPLKSSYDGNVFLIDPALKKALPVDFEYIFADMALIYGSKEKLVTWLSEGGELVDTKLQRLIKMRGQKVTEINYGNVSPWKAPIVLKNLIRKYEVRVQTLQVDYL